MVLAGQLSALGAVGAVGVVLAVSRPAGRALARAWDLYGPGARRRARAVRARLAVLLATEPPQRPDRAAWAAGAARLTAAAHGRHVRIPAPRTPKD
jgi:hypothetical protein